MHIVDNHVIDIVRRYARFLYYSVVCSSSIFLTVILLLLSAVFSFVSCYTKKQPVWRLFSSSA